MKSNTELSIKYLLQEAVLFLSLSYVILLGGTFNGLVLFELNVANTLLLTGLGAGWFIWSVIRRRSPPTTRLDWGILAILGAYVVATIFSSDPRRSMIALTQLAIYTLIFYLCVDMLRNGWTADLFVKTLLIVSAFIVFFGLWEISRWYATWFSIRGGSGWVPPSTYRVRAFLGHPNFVADYFILLLPLGVARLVNTRRLFNRLLLVVWSLLVLIIVFFTSSRGGWLGMAAALGSMIGLMILDQPNIARSVWMRFRARPVLIIPLLFAFLFGLFVLLPALGRQATHPTHGSGFASRSGIWGVAWDSFREDPISGRGPFTYGTEFMGRHSFPPEMLLAHAHSYIINTAGEVGILGLLAIGLFMIFLLRAVKIRWRGTSSGNRMLLIGVLASLMGVAVHSLFDTPETFPALSIIIAILLGLIIGKDKPPPRRSQFWLTSGMLLLCWLGVVAFMWYTLRAYAPHIRGVRASNEGNWEAAAEQIQQAAELDPGLAFYWFQVGYAHGQLALSADGSVRDREHLSAAIEAYERGIKIEPMYATNWANMGILYWAHGDADRAISALEEAATRAPREPAFRLTLGRILEATGEIERARTAYEISLSQRPFWARAYFFRATEFRKAVQTVWIDANPLAHFLGANQLEEGWDAIQDSQFEKAQRIFEEVLGVNTSEAYLGLGVALRGLGMLDEAGQSLEKAKFVSHLSGWTTVLIELEMGKLATIRGDCSLAIQHNENALELLNRTTSLGIGRMGLSEYGWYIYYRDSIAADLLPGVDYIVYTDEVVHGMLELAECYITMGDHEQAASVLTYALSVAPDDQAIQDRLRDLE